YPARSIAARALARLAFPQLEALSPALIHAEMQRAYQCLHFYRLCSGESRGRLVLSRYYRGQPAVIVDFVLALLTLGGRLPHFERISAALRFGSRKERGDALETIEQGVSRDIFRLLLPLVDGRSIEEQLQFFQSRFRPDPIAPAEIVRAALESSS